MAGGRRGPWSRAAAGALAVMALAVLAGLLTGTTVTRYDVVLDGCVVLGSAAAAADIWWNNGFEARLAAVVLAGLTVVGQVLVVTLGRPGAGQAHWSPAALAVLVLGVAVPVLVALDARSAAGPETPPHRPYAL